MTALPEPFIIAEGGVNHNGDPDLALELVEAAAVAGADAIKFQHFDPARLTAVDAGLADYQKANLGADQTQREMLSALTLPLAALKAAAKRAEERGLRFLCTPFDEVCADQIADLVPAWKVSSTDLTNWPLLAHLCDHGRPLLLSTGMATLNEVVETVAYLKPMARGQDGFPPITVLHCVSAYPAPVDQCHISALPEIASATEVPVGYSDHTLGIGVAVAAAAFGATVIEKHLTLDVTMPGPDHRASLAPQAFAAMVTAVRDAAAAVGDPVKAPQPSEIEHRVSVRRGLYFAADLPAGHRLDADDLIALRPATGLPPSKRDTILGKALRRPVAAGTPVVEEDVSA